MERLLQDLRYGSKMLLKQPGFTAIAVIALALGIGANTAIFSVVNGVLFRSLAYEEPDRLAVVWEHNFPRDRRQNVVSPANFLDWVSQNTVFEQMAAIADFRVNLTGSGEPEEIQAQLVTASFFPLLGVPTFNGRAFTDEEDRRGNSNVAILSHKLWQRRFGGDPQIVGQPTLVNGNSYTVVGIMPPDFHFLNNQTELWLPMALDPGRNYRTTSGRYMRAVARLKPGVSIQQAQVEMTGIAAHIEEANRDFNAGWGVNLVSMHEQVVGDIRPTLIVLIGAVGFVLLIACANVANLQLARAATRQKELAIRTALGAGRLRLIRQMLTESVLLAFVGGALGLLLAYWGIDLLIALSPDNIPRLNEIGIDLRVLSFTLAVSILTGVIFGLLPAIQASRPDLNESLKEGARGSTGGRSRMFRNLFVVSEVALALVLLVGAGLMIRSFLALQKVSPGFNAADVLTMRILLPGSKYGEAHQRVAFYRQAEQRLGTLPGVRAVGAINFLPLTGPASATRFTIVGQPEPAPGEHPGTEVRVVTPNYFTAMAIPLLKGRLLDERDSAESRVLVINEAMAKRHFPDEDPIGKRLQISWSNNVADEIVGIVGDIKDAALDTEVRPTIFWPHAREPYSFMNMIVRTGAEPMKLATAAQSEIKAIDSDQPVADIRTMEAVMAKSIARPRFNALLLGIFAAVALVLASVGIYGVMAYSVSQRTHEIGIRMALGARQQDILRLVVGQGMLLTLAGVGIGVIASWALTRVMASLLFGVTATDLLTFAVVSVVLSVVAFLASFIPARKATRVDPMVALRYE